MLAAALLLTALPIAPQEPDAAELQRELARLVDLPSERGRKLAAEALAKKELTTLDGWLAACAGFGEFAELEPGTSRQEVDLLVLGETERTELHLYVPENYDPHKPAPLLLWGHGAGGSGARQYRQWRTVADDVGMLVLAPTEFGEEPGWGFSPRERAAQLAALRWARRNANVDENAIFVGGVSRGGHMAWDLALRFPDVFAGAVPCVGGPRLAVGEQNNMRYLGNVVHLPIRDLQGSKDDPLLLKNLRLAFARLKKRKAKDAVLIEFPERGHSYDLSGVDWRDFFGRRRDPWPKRATRMAADLDEARAAWVRITGVERDVKVKAVPRVSQAHWARLDDSGRRRLLHDKLVELTAELEVTDRGKGRFTAKSEGVRSFELLLAPDMIGRKNAVEVRWNSRPVRETARPGVAVLLTEFAERFDRTFLPVARIRVP